MNNITELETKLLNRFSTVSNAEITEGMEWYQSAHNFALKVSKHLRIPLFKVVGVLSALSPRNKWHRNKVDTIELIKRGKHGKFATFNGNRDKALRILESKDINEVRNILNAKKTTSFFNNIMYPTVNSTVTIDAWAYRTLDFDAKNKYYRDSEQAYKNAASKLGLRPHNLQAILWINIRNNWIYETKMHKVS